MRTALALVIVLVAGCSNAGGSSSGAPGSTSTAAAIGTGPLAAKAATFEATLAARHLPQGLVVNIDYDAAGNVIGHGNLYDACIWTGVYIGTEAMRYRVTHEPEALARVEEGLRAIHRLHETANDPGFVARDYTRPDDTSRDQFVGLMFGYALSWEVIADPALRAQVRDDVRAIAARFLRDDMEMRNLRGGRPTVHFRLAPNANFRGAITPQNWATVDDFPLNLLVKAVPYDPAIAAALEAAPWPAIGGSDAFHGLAFFRTFATITGDPAVEDHYLRVLAGQRQYMQAAERYGTIFDDLLAGRNLAEVERILLGINAALSGAVQVALAQRLGSLAPAAAFFLQAIVDVALKAVADAITDAITFLNDPANRARVARSAAVLELLARLFDAIGERDAARALRSVSTAAGQVAAADLDELADTMRSYVGENLLHLSAIAAMTNETDPTLRAFYSAHLDRDHRYVGDEGNAFFDFTGAAFGASGPDPVRVAAARRTLELYPTDPIERIVDNGGDPAVVVSSWPDRFGRTGNHATEVFPIDRRAPHHFVWQQHPREIRSGSPSGTAVTHLGYLTAYWLGRWQGFLDADD